jgi:hypothetical protein
LYAAFYLPLLLSKDDSKKPGLEEMDSGIFRIWAPPDWRATINGDMPSHATRLEFTVLLPGFTLGSSSWQSTASMLGKNNTTIPVAMTPTCHLTAAGLVLNYKHMCNTHIDTALKVDYRPSTGLDGETESSTKFLLRHS